MVVYKAAMLLGVEVFLSDSVPILLRICRLPACQAVCLHVSHRVCTETSDSLQGQGTVC